MYIVAGAFRLARFNVIASSNTPTKYSVGIPIPMPAVYICSFIILN